MCVMRCALLRQLWQCQQNDDEGCGGGQRHERVDVDRPLYI